MTMRDIVTNEWFTILIVLSLTILAVTKHIYTKRFLDFIALIGNSKYLKIYSRSQKNIDTFDAFLFVNLIISSSIFCYIVYTTLIVKTNFESILFLKIAVSISALLLIKTIIEGLVGSVFEIEKLVDSYIFQKASYKNYIGLVLLPINVLFIYTVPPTKPLVYISIILLAFIHSIGFLNILKTHQKLVLNNWFYFILYLCTLEIGPYIILYKVFN